MPPSFGKLWARTLSIIRTIKTLEGRLDHAAQVAADMQVTIRHVADGVSGVNSNLTNLAKDVSVLQHSLLSVQGQMQLEFQRARESAGGGPSGGGSSTLYLDLLESVLTGMIYCDGAQSGAGGQPYDEVRRSLGRDWPDTAATMIGRARMRNLRNLLESAVQLDIEGDFIETGVWRGGACIYARAIFDAHAQKSRKVFVADSFKGLPEPNVVDYPDDAGDTHFQYSELAISREEVQENFRRFGLLSDNVVFLEGWFKDTLPQAPVEKLCVLRLDGDLYESTMVALKALYDKVSPGGYVIVDDYLLPTCAKAVEDFRSERGISATLNHVDGAAVWWQVSKA